SGVWLDSPVTLPPGRAKLATTPVSTGSPAVANTIGITDVACFAARTGGVLCVRMTSTFSRTNSAANSAKRSLRPSAQRLIPAATIAFIVARITFWIGYRINPLYRAFGMGATGYLNVGLLAFALWKAVELGA